jgi:hypothetical protein
MIAWIKARWAEPSTRIGLAVLLLMWAAAIIASLLVSPERWPQVKEALLLPMGLASGGSVLAMIAQEKPPCG